MVSYAYPEGVEGYLKIQIEKADGCITLKFIDGGVPFNPLERDMPDVSLPLEERQIGGLGIFLTVQMMDNVSYEHVGNENILTIKKKIDDEK